MNVAPIPATFSKNGYEYRLLKYRVASNNRRVFAVYEQNKEGKTVAWESVVAVFAPDRQSPSGVFFPAGFKLPSNESWGKFGFTYRTEDRALNKMEELRLEYEEWLKNYT